MIRYRAFAATILSACAWATPLQADVAPPPDYVEKCTLERVRGPSEECESCGTYFAEPRKCSDTLGSRGFQQRCRTNGASTWTEIWCRPAAAPQPENQPRTYAQPPPQVAVSESQTSPYQPPAPPPRGCGGCTIGSRPGAVALLLAAAALAWVMHRRRIR